MKLLHVDDLLEASPGGREEQLRSQLRQLSETESSADHLLSYALREGLPAEEIAKEAACWPADLLVLVTHARTGLARFVFGSLADQVIRHSPCPVLILHRASCGSTIAQEPISLRKILVPIDFSARSRGALQMAVKIARQTGAEVTLLNCLHFLGAYGELNQPGFDTEELSVVAKERTESAMQCLLRTEVPAELPKEGLVTRGAPEEVIPHTAALECCDLIVCGTHGGAPLRHALLGSTAEAIVRRASCPVLVVPAR